MSKLFVFASLGFRPTLWSTVFTLIGIIALCSLGTWQLDRLSWKSELITERQAGFAAAPTPLPADNHMLQQQYWRRVTVEGAYDHDNEIFLAARSMRGNVGFHVLTPFRRQSGQYLLINRGWIPKEKLDPINRIEGQIGHEFVLEGIATPGARKGIFMPENRPETSSWLYVDYEVMGRHTGRSLQPVVVDAIGKVPGGYPIGGQTRIDLPNDHLQYAMTWFALALSLAGIWFFWNRQHRGVDDHEDQLRS